MNLEALRQPFDPSEVEFRAGATNGDKTRALALPFITSRAVQDRLDAVVGPENWKDNYQPGPDGGVMCTISIKIEGEWVPKSGIGENSDFEAIKGGESDSFKRAAVKWGIGRYLYGLPGVWVAAEQRGKSVTIDEGEARAKLFGGQRQAPASQPTPRSNGSKPAHNGEARSFETLDALVEQLCKDFGLTKTAAKAELKAANYSSFKVSESGNMYQAVKARIEAQK